MRHLNSPESPAPAVGLALGPTMLLKKSFQRRSLNNTRRKALRHGELQNFCSGDRGVLPNRS